VYGWGRGEHGRLGFGDDKSSKMVPQRVQLLVGDGNRAGFLWRHSLRCIYTRWPHILVWKRGPWSFRVWKKADDRSSSRSAHKHPTSKGFY
ncbi:hypothetical protein MIMGU_mgv1a0089021mg, partial [Erythranthe guttata]